LGWRALEGGWIDTQGIVCGVSCETGKTGGREDGVNLKDIQKNREENVRATQDVFRLGKMRISGQKGTEGGAGGEKSYEQTNSKIKRGAQLLRGGGTVSSEGARRG